MSGSREGVRRPVDDEARRIARQLVRTARYGVASTVSPDGSGPLASRVMVSTGFDGSPFLVVSALAAHTPAMRADPRMSLLLDRPAEGEPMAAPRITLRCRAVFTAPDDRAAERMRRRFVARHPQGEAIMALPDFSLVGLQVTSAALIAGFARAYDLGPSDVVDDEITGLADRERAVADHMNDDHRDALATLATRIGQDPEQGWRIATIDRMGFEMTSGSNRPLHRIEFADAVREPDGYRNAFVTLLRGPVQ